MPVLLISVLQEALKSFRVCFFNYSSNHKQSRVTHKHLTHTSNTKGLDFLRFYLA